MVLEILGYNPHISVTCGLGLGNLSEFSFIIATAGLTLNQISPEIFSAITLTIMGTIIFTPYFLRYNERTFKILKKIWDKLPFKVKIESKRMPEGEVNLKKDHVILVGCDRMGSKILDHLVEYIDKNKIIVVDYNPDIIEWLKREKINCIYGDVYNENVIEKLPFKSSKMLIITIPDEDIVINLIQRAEEINPDLISIAKAETTEDAIELYDRDAELVVLPESIAGEKVCEYIKNLPKTKREIKRYRYKHLKLLEKELKRRNNSFTSHLLKKVLKLNP